MESVPSSGNTLASEYALRVALQTMKERCVVLQRRLTVLEEDNQQLRENIDQKKSIISLENRPANNAGGSELDELLQLRIHVGELNRQKQQLSEHINMVSNENRKLWSRLSQIAKDKTRRTDITNGQDFTLLNEELDDLQASPRNGNGVNQNLVRSKTFTQHFPNPNLRHKLIPDGSELSMEEVALNNFESKGELVEGVNDFADHANNVLGFAYLNVDDGADGDGNDDSDINAVARKYMDSLQEIKREAINQQKELTSTLNALESKIALQPCKNCANKSQKPEMADKSLETDESLGEMLHGNGKDHIKDIKAWSSYEGSDEGEPLSLNEAVDETFLGVNGYYDNQKILNIEPCERLCPMCGKKYDNTVPFEPFQQHVEAHFVEMGIEL